jgi:hypothetical protein
VHDRVTAIAGCLLLPLLAACYSQHDVVPGTCAASTCTSIGHPAEQSDAGALPSVGASVVAEARDEASLVFDAALVRSYELEVAEADLASIDARPSEERYVPAMLTFEGRRYGPIGVRYKGSVGAFFAPCTASTIPGSRTGPKVGKCSMKLAFDELDDEARFFGLKKLNLHAMGRDLDDARAARLRSLSSERCRGTAHGLRTYAC